MIFVFVFSKNGDISASPSLKRDLSARDASDSDSENPTSNEPEPETDAAADLEPPTKRLKPGQAAAAAISPYPQWAGSFWPKNAMLWDPDGDVVIISGDMGFRVHKSTLVDCSELFRDVLCNGDRDGDVPDADLESALGCRDIVHVPEATADVYHLLLALQDDR